MLDVLVPVQLALAEGRDPVLAANEAADATMPMKAERGRASFLGERSIGHMDPGARSSALMVAAVAEVVGTRA
jgi:dihydroxyacetone kinase-like protein